MTASRRPTAKGGPAWSVSNRSTIQAISSGSIRIFHHEKHRPTHQELFKRSL